MVEKEEKIILRLIKCIRHISYWSLQNPIFIDYITTRITDIEFHALKLLKS